MSLNHIPAIYTFINLTPHDVGIVLPSGERLTIRASGTVARVEQTSRFLTRSSDPEGDELGSRTVEIAEPVYGEVTGLPDPREGVAFIVSQMVAARSARTDLLYPDSGPDAIREAGQVVAVRRLLRSPLSATPQVAWLAVWPCRDGSLDPECPRSGDEVALGGRWMAGRLFESRAAAEQWACDFDIVHATNQGYETQVDPHAFAPLLALGDGRYRLLDDPR